jgi:hypothetical protein
MASGVNEGNNYAILRGYIRGSGCGATANGRAKISARPRWTIHLNRIRAGFEPRRAGGFTQYGVTPKRFATKQSEFRWQAGSFHHRIRSYEDAIAKRT